MNTDHPAWQEAAGIIIQQIYALKNLRQADHVIIRDFRKAIPGLDSYMVDNGFFKVNMPPTNIVEKIDWISAEGLYNKLSKNAKTQLRKKVLRNIHLFDTVILTGDKKQVDLEHIYELYLAVKNRSLELNTFALPRKYFEAIVNNGHWEIIQLTIGGKQKPCCYILCHYSGEAYSPMVIGLDYTFNAAYNIYRQALYQLMLRAALLGAIKIHFGFSADTEKQKLGAISYATFGYMHTDDSYNLEKMLVLDQSSAN